MQTAVIFDVDGTLADVTSIRHYVLQRRKDFDAFHSLRTCHRTRMRCEPRARRPGGWSRCRRSPPGARSGVTTRRSGWRSTGYPATRCSCARRATTAGHVREGRHPGYASASVTRSFMPWTTNPAIIASGSQRRQLRGVPGWWKDVSRRQRVERFSAQNVGVEVVAPGIEGR